MASQNSNIWGSILSNDGECSDDIDHKITKANFAMKPFRRLFWSKKMPRKRKFNIFKTFIYSIILYGCETWTLKIVDKNKLDIWWRKQLRKLMNITLFDKVKNEDLYKEFDTKPLSELIEERRWRYFAHLYRYEEARWTKFCLTAKLAGGKDFMRVGNKMTWLKSIKNIGDGIKEKVDAEFDFALAYSKSDEIKREWKELLLKWREEVEKDSNPIYIN